MIDPELRGLPSDPELERMVLGGILIEPEAIFDLQEAIQPEDFTITDHQRIYAAMVALAEADRPIGRLEIADHLGPDKLKAIGGFTRLAALDDGMPRIHDLPAMARKVVAIARRRAVLSQLAALYRTVETAADESILPRLDALTEAISAPLEAREWLDAGEIADRVGGIETLLLGPDQRGAIVPPWPRLAAIMPGFLPGQFGIFAARPGVGKTIALSQIMMAAADQAIPCRMVSLEMLGEDVVTRMVCARKGISLGKIKHGHASVEEKRLFYNGFGEVNALPLRIRDNSEFTTAALAAALRREKGRIKCVLIDYVGLMDGPGRTPYERVTTISRSLKRLAIEQRVCVIAAAQLNRQSSSENRPPELYDLRDAGSLEQDADFVVMLHELKEEPVEGQRRVDMLLRKNRTGGLGQIPMLRVGKYSRLEEL